MILYFQLLTTSYLNRWNSVRHYVIWSLQIAQTVAALLALCSHPSSNRLQLRSVQMHVATLPEAV